MAAILEPRAQGPSNMNFTSVEIVFLYWLEMTTQREVSEPWCQE